MSKVTKKHILKLSPYFISSVISVVLISGCSLFSDDAGEVHTLIEEPNKSESELLDSGMSSLERNLFNDSREQMEQLAKEYPSSYWASLAKLKTADAYFFSGKSAEAITAYEEFIRQHPKHEAIPYAQLMNGASHLIEYRGRIHDQAPLKSAIKIFNTLLEQQPNSSYTALARKYLQLSRRELSKHEVEVAKFYIRQGMYASASSRLHDICLNYPEFETSKQAAYLLKYAFAGKRIVNAKHMKNDSLSTDKKSEE